LKTNVVLNYVIQVIFNIKEKDHAMHDTFSIKAVRSVNFLFYYFSYMLKYYFIQLLFIVVIIVSIINFLYTFGYQGEPMSQVEFLSRTLGSIIFGSISFLQLMKKKN